jgi:bifunctional UDP-N-acetylglucosamine pyrophosphorylase/glucosamine-1-phosphate N-acetyltransferase
MLEVIVLAAGEGRRMNSAYPKVLQPIGGRAMLLRLLDSVRQLDPDRIHVVVGAGAEHVERALDGSSCRLVTQAERLGTGHAAAQVLPQVDRDSRLLILPGDMPLVRPETLRALLDLDADLSILSFIAENPTGYGRILRGADGRVSMIREEKDASDEERAVREVNSGVLAARAADLAGWLERIDRNNAQGEYYLTDCIGLAADEDRTVRAAIAEAAEELLGANDRAQLAQIEAVFQRRARQALLAAGATLAAPETVQIRGQVEVGRDVFIDANVALIGEVRLGDGCQIGTGCVVDGAHLAAGTCLKPYCVIEGAITEGPCTLGPFARIRPGTRLEAGVKIGNFVETKNAHFAPGAKASHLSYIGDAEVGAEANIGAGTITCNYDGVSKHRTEIGPGAFIGSNSALVAPVRIGERAVVGAGSVVTHEAPAGELTVARARQRSIPGWSRPRKSSES